MIASRKVFKFIQLTYFVTIFAQLLYLPKQTLTSTTLYRKSSSTMSTSVLVQPVNSPDDFAAVYHCIREAFVRQIRDSIWISMNPEWGSPEGQREGASKLLRRWQSATKNEEGQPNTIILKASVPNPQDETKHKIVGAAIWSQTSFVDGHGDRPTDSPADVAALSDTEKRFASQMYRSLWKRRVAL